MIIDSLHKADQYSSLGNSFRKAFAYLKETDFSQLPKGRYEIDGDNIFAIVNEYDTVDAAKEQMEAHRRHIDVQYVAAGEELIGHGFLNGQTPSKAYDNENDYMLFGEKPDFFSRLEQGMFAIFFPSDLHVPGIRVNAPAPVKKVVIKIKVD